jgi:hypothetical protein
VLRGALWQAGAGGLLWGLLAVAVVQEGGQEEEVAMHLEQGFLGVVQEQVEGQEEAVALHLAQTCFTA